MLSYRVPWKMPKTVSRMFPPQSPGFQGIFWIFFLGFYVSIGVQSEKWVPQNPPEFIAIHYCSGPTVVERIAALLQQSVHLFNRLPAPDPGKQCGEWNNHWAIWSSNIIHEFLTEPDKQVSANHMGLLNFINPSLYRKEKTKKRYISAGTCHKF
jgi:hypothetical protein